jgi:purine-cytosine permease-like protein
MAFLSLGVDVPLRWARAVVALVFGAVGFVIALVALADAAHSYEAFLLVIVYWIGPWLGVVLTDQYLRRGGLPVGMLYDRGYRNHAGVIAMLAGMVVSVPLFANQALFTGLVPALVPGVGDVASIVGFVLAGAVYAVLFPRLAGSAARAAE